MTGRKKARNVIYNVITVIVLILFLFPIYWMVITSLKDTGEIFAKVPTFFPKNITFDGYISQLSVIGSVPLWRQFLNSFIIATLSTLISATLAVFSAYGLARFKLKLNKTLMFVVLVTQMMPTVLFLSPLFITFQKIGVLDTLLAPVLYTSLQSIPFCIITLRPYFLDIPGELQDAALIDGCGRFKTFTKVMVPISYPGIVVSAAFTFLWGWGDLMGALTFIQTDSLQPLTVNMYKAIGEFGIEWNNLMAYAVILTLPVMIMFLFLQKYLISGITAGAVKA
ncbi:carbohydrate ABC transporter permease [Ruminococcus sp. CLA-AA-H200]|uniref:Carbohydrate ABC transporter permease n=1 Tax=Ruminococcus turbiniformis TaxID=2881258 RepID=A0ABS8FTG0_9FIRM|nr:carbohydrate ABC transporter permease [Ruminococcus turbiniformis]MCC2253340.1 carbohydrate ABC transporter permease [Ruminococcus turbiniformis]